MSEEGSTSWLKKAENDLQKNYGDSVLLRMLVSAIPTIGGPIDIALTSRYSENRIRRIESLCEEIIKTQKNVVVDVHSDEFVDFVADIFSRAVDSRTEEKRKRFARVFTKQMDEGRPWDEAFDASRVVSQFDDIHIEILREAISAPLWPREDQRQVHAVALAQHGEDIPLLQEMLPHYSKNSLELACAELVSNGLLVDEGRQRADMRLLTWFSPCDLSYWLYDWSLGPKKKQQSS